MQNSLQNIVLDMPRDTMHQRRSSARLPGDHCGSWKMKGTAIVAVSDGVGRRRRLAGELRRLRIHTGQTVEDAAERLGWSGSKLSRIETHRIGVKPADLDRLLDLYQVGEPLRGRLAALAQGSGGRAWWEAYAGTLPEDVTTFIALEAEAVAQMDCATEVVPGLLQTADYARAVLRLVPATLVPPGQIERMVEMRMRTQELLDGNQPVRLTVVADEAVLLRQIGSPAVMRGQLKQLIETSYRANVTLRVLPLNAEHLAIFGGFVIMEFDASDGPALGDVVGLEQLNGLHLYDDEAVTYRYRLSFEQIAAAALDPAQSRQLIAEIIRDRWS
jgi:transcriptional regulator with XRE-family HTH domain